MIRVNFISQPVPEQYIKFFTFLLYTVTYCIVIKIFLYNTAPSVQNSYLVVDSLLGFIIEKIACTSHNVFCILYTSDKL